MAGGIPLQQSEPKVALNAVFDVISGMDLFAPKKNQNDYGARKNKNLKVGTLQKKSYVPAGLTKAQYAKVRATDQKKKNDNYDRNVKKAFKFQSFYGFYKGRGTDTKADWKKTITSGHTMAKTKYDWSVDNPSQNGCEYKR